jgi:hypothetical protein
MRDRVTIIEDLHIAQRVVAAISHRDPILCPTHHNSAAGRPVYINVRVTIKVNAYPRASNSDVPGLSAVRQRGITPPVNHHGAVVPRSA